KERAGLFTRGAFLARHADATDDSPVGRGDAILRHLLCFALQVPANILVPPVADPRPNQTTRQRLEAHSMNACAVECHQKIIDPLGYAFEHYDATGAWRT